MSVPVLDSSSLLARFVQAARSAPAKPYRSLKAFRFADAGILAAREQEIERLVRLITMYRGVLLYGESGAGKSSVVNAGALPRLAEDGFWPHRVRVQPRAGNEFALEPIFYSDEDDGGFLPSAFVSAARDGRLVLGAGDLPAAVSAAAEAAPILLVFDQFEELVTLFPEGSALTHTQAGILAAIVTLLRARDVPVKLLFAFREDYLASLEPLLKEAPELAHQSLRLVPPPLQSAPEIIRAPFERFPAVYSSELSPELAVRIAGLLADRSAGSDLNLSELQIVCRRLWEADDPDSLLTERGIAGLLEDHLGEAIGTFPSNLRVAAISVLSQMVTPRGTRNVIAEHDLIDQASGKDDLSPELLREALGRLELESGLIRRERRHDIDLYEITSEFLIPWITRRRDELREAHARRRYRRRMCLLGALMLGLVLVAAGILKLALTARDGQLTAQRERATATFVGLTATAQALLPSRPDLSLLLALEADLHAPPHSSLALARSTLLAAHEKLWQSGVVGVLHGHTDAVTSVAFQPGGSLLASASGDGTIRLWSDRTLRQVGPPLRGPRGGVFSVAFSPDGRVLASGHQSGAVELWASTGRRLAVQPSGAGQSSAVSVAFSPDRRWLAAARLDGTIALWALAGDRPVGQPAIVSAPRVRSIAFSPDSAMLASVGGDKQITLWRLGSGPPRTPVAHGPVGSPLYTVAFSPAGHLLAAGGLDGRVWTWDLGGRAPAALTGSLRSPIYGVAFSHDGRTLASANARDTVQLWDVAGRHARGQLSGPTGIVTSVAFSSDDRRLAAGSLDNTIQLWDPSGSQATFGAPLVANPADWGIVSFTPAHGWLAWAENDPGAANSIRLWDSVHGRSVATIRSGPSGRGGLRGLALSPDGTLLVSSSEGGTVQRWHVPSGRPDGPPIHQQAGVPIYSVAFSRDGRQLAFGGENGTIGLTDPVTGRTRNLRAASTVYSVAFNATGTVLATGEDNRSIELWNTVTGARMRTLSGHTDAVFSVSFSPTSPLLASGGADDTVRLWDPSTGAQIAELNGHSNFVRSVAFDPTGETLASGSADGTIRFWDVSAHSALGQALPATGFVNSIAFSPDGLSLASASRNGPVRLWNPVALPAGGVGLEREVCGLLGAGLDAQERLLYAPTDTYHDPCP